MTLEPVLLSRVVGFTAALVYWAGVWIQARRVRRWIGKSPNVKPRGPKEKLLWVGWFAVVGLWLAIPFLAGRDARWPWAWIVTPFGHPLRAAAGMLLMAAGYAGTLWSYAAMGKNWRMGINPSERTVLVTWGPFRFVRHPIYLFQFVMLAGLTLLLPTGLSLLAMGLHLICVLFKTADEEVFLQTVHPTYQDYQSRTGKLFPKLWGKR